MTCMDCEEVLHEIQLFIDGEVSTERASTLSAHLGHCSPCMERAEFQAKLKEIVRTKCRSEVPDHLMVRIRRVIRTDAGPPG